MKTITTPEAHTVNTVRKTALLQFPKAAGIHPMECHVRGGVCWPVPVPSRANRLIGAAVLVGQAIATGEHIVFEEQEFFSVDHITDASGWITHNGLAGLLTTAWGKYACDTFYYNQRDEMHRKYLIECMDAPGIKPKPHFVEMLWASTDDPLQRLYELDTMQRLTMPPPTESIAAAALEEYEMDPGRPPTPALHALLCALHGMQRHPWREPKDQPERIELVRQMDL